MISLHDSLPNLLELSRECAVAVMGRLARQKTFTLGVEQKAESLLRRALLRGFKGVLHLDDTLTPETTIPDGQLLLFRGIDGIRLLEADMRIPSGVPPQGFGNTLCLVEKHETKVAVIHQMGSNQLFYAVSGGGCFRIHGDTYQRFMAGEKVFGEQFTIAGFVAPLVDDVTGPFMLALPQSGTDETAPAYNAYMKLRRDLKKRKLLHDEADYGCTLANAVAVLLSRNAACVYALGRRASELAAASLCISEAGGVATNFKGQPLQWQTLSSTVVWAKSTAVADCLFPKAKPKTKAAPKPRTTRKKKETA